MRIIIQKNETLEKLVDGLSLLDNQDRERIIEMVNTLNAADMKVKNEIFFDVPPLKLDLTSAYANDKI